MYQSSRVGRNSCADAALHDSFRGRHTPRSTTSFVSRQHWLVIRSSGKTVRRSHPGRTRAETLSDIVIIGLAPTCCAQLARWLWFRCQLTARKPQDAKNATSLIMTLIDIPWFWFWVLTQLRVSWLGYSTKHFSNLCYCFAPKAHLKSSSDTRQNAVVIVCCGLGNNHGTRKTTQVNTGCSFSKLGDPHAQQCKLEHGPCRPKHGIGPGLSNLSHLSQQCQIRQRCAQSGLRRLDPWILTPALVQQPCHVRGI